MNAASSHCPDGRAGLYIHIPYCCSKCPYCSFNSYPLRDTGERRSYWSALMQQAKVMADHPWSAAMNFGTLYIGGGTPTICRTRELTELLNICRASFNFMDGAEPTEITVEANPNTVTAEKLQALRKAGVNRLSLGVQSFADTMLTRLGRNHLSYDSIKSFHLARAAGFTNISLDLMYCLPGQDPADWQATLETALELEPEHISCYELTIEEDTVFAELFHQGELCLPNEEASVQMEAVTCRLLEKADYARYEISNYARSGFQCRHNINYWQNGRYLGLGAGAVSCFDGVRIRSIKKPAHYIQVMQEGRFPFQDGEGLPLEASFRETVIMGLRMMEGVNCRLLAERFGLTPITYYGKTLKDLLANDLLEMRADSLRLTTRGLPIANQVLAQLV